MNTMRYAIILSIVFRNLVSQTPPSNLDGPGSSPASLCRICGGQSGTVPGLSLSNAGIT